MANKQNEVLTEIRIDKWLWTARFFKTRGLAIEAIKGGKVDLNGHRAKPAKTVKIGCEISLRKDPYAYALVVTGLSRHRGSATIAATLYQETDESLQKRQQRAEQLKAESATRPRYPGRPSKRDRRKITRFVRKSSE